MGAIIRVLRSRYFRYAFWALLFLLLTLWTGNWWLLLVQVVLFDHYITRRVHWLFWRKRGVAKQKVWVEWVDSFLFAVVAAYLIRLLLFEAFMIPSGSMEKSLLIGDYLFVSKLSYGPKLPNTPLAVPFTDHTLPFTRRTPSYVRWIERAYNRRAGLGSVERGDVVVFHFPEGDTVVLQYPEQSYYAIVRELGRDYVLRTFDIAVRPVDKCENYIKRCVAIAGDTLQISGGRVVVNGEERDYSPAIQHNYRVHTDGTKINSLLLDGLGVNLEDRRYDALTHSYEMPLVPSSAEAVSKIPNVRGVEQMVDRFFGSVAQVIFPHDARYGWTEDNFGPLVVPKRGVSVSLTLDNLPLYRRIIEVYEGNHLEVVGDTIRVNGAPCDRYTFGMDYYFMMGDNRHNSLDSRFWGFVPEDRIVGKAVLVWMSLDRSRAFPFNIRWDRLFSQVE